MHHDHSDAVMAAALELVRWCLCCAMTIKAALDYFTPYQDIIHNTRAVCDGLQAATWTTGSPQQGPLVRAAARLPLLL